MHPDKKPSYAQAARLRRPQKPQGNVSQPSQPTPSLPSKLQGKLPQRSWPIPTPSFEKKLGVNIKPPVASGPQGQGSQVTGQSQPIMNPDDLLKLNKPVIWK